MKKIIVALFCIVHVTCFAMQGERVRDIPRNLYSLRELSVSNKEQAESLQVIAHSNRFMACMAMREYDRKHHHPDHWKKFNCEDIYEQYLALEKNSDQL